MKNKWIYLIGSFALILPLLAIFAVYLIYNINIFDNPDFWYGYMAYFGTVSLAIVSLKQNDNANKLNQRIVDMTRKEKIAYLAPAKNQIIRDDTMEFRYLKKGNSFGVIEKIDLFIDGKLIKSETSDHFFEETNTESISELQIKTNIPSKNNELKLRVVLHWRNQYDYKYNQIVDILYKKDPRRNHIYLSDYYEYKIEYID